MPAHVVLGGSCATGRSTPLSDSDYFIVSDTFPIEYYFEKFSVGKRRVDIEFRSYDQFHLYLSEISAFRLNISGRPCVVGHGNLRFLCRLFQGIVIDSDDTVFQLLTENKVNLQNAIAVAVATHYYNLLEDFVGWFLSDQHQDIILNATELYQRSCLLASSHRQLTDPSVKWGWRNLCEFANKQEKKLIDSFVPLYLRVCEGRASPIWLINLCDAIVGLGYVKLDSNNNFKNQLSVLEKYVYLRGVPNQRIAYDLVDNAPNVVTDGMILSRIESVIRVANEN